MTIPPAALHEKRANMATQIVPAEQALTPMAMIDRAVTSGASIETLEKLMALQERWDKNQARKAFDNAMSAAKSEIPVITKNRTVDFTGEMSKKRTNYQYEDMAGIANIIDPVLSKYGLSYRYRTETNEGMVKVTCVISHRDGHSEENSLAAGRDETGNKNNIQAVGSTITYLQRYSLKAALGLAAARDDDAARSETAFITIEQQESLKKLGEEIGEQLGNLSGLYAGFLKKFKIEKISDLPVKEYENAITALEMKRVKK